MYTWRVWIASLCVAGLVCARASSQAPSAPARPPSLLKASFANLPIYFVENRGVYPDEVAYYVKGRDKTFFFGRDGITFLLHGPERGWAVKLVFVDASPAVALRGEDRQTAVFSYFRGPEKDWKTGLPTFSRVMYENLWPGIDLVYRGEGHHLKYDFVIRPGADPGLIRLNYRGASTVRISRTGALHVDTPAGPFDDAPPVAWQVIGGSRVPVETSYRLNGRDSDGDVSFGFTLGSYDARTTLVLDPALPVYCGYIGGAGDDHGFAVAVDRQGFAYVTGQTLSSSRSFPTHVGPDATYQGGWHHGDAFVAKVTPDGTGLVYCGYIGGTGDDYGRGIAVDSTGNAYLAGETQSGESNFPVTQGPGLKHGGGMTDAFVAKVNAKGTALVYCGYIGGSAPDGAYGIAVDANGHAHVAGSTASDENSFPVATGPDTTHNGWLDAFVARVNAQGTALDYCGYIGGIGAEVGSGIDVDTAGNAYLSGYTDSDQTTFPVRAGPDLTFNGKIDAFVAKVNAQGTALDYCGYIGGTGTDYGYGLSLDPSGSAFVVGETDSNHITFPVRIGPDVTFNGITDAFVAKVDTKGTSLDYCGYIGGATADSGRGIAVDGAGNASVTGQTGSDSMSFPVVIGPDLTFNGITDAFVARVNTKGTALDYCGYIGGIGTDVGTGVAVDTAGNTFVAGHTGSDENSFPVRCGPTSTHAGGAADAFVARFSTVRLDITGAARPNGKIHFDLSAPPDRGRSYQIGTSCGTGPIPVDSRWLHLSPDGLLFASALDLLPGIFADYRGVIGSNGLATAAMNIPNLPAVIGVRLHSAFVTADPAAPSGIASISNTVSFSITK